MSRDALYDREMLSYFQAMKYEYRLNPLVIGATSGSGGGSGTPPGGIVGQLAQIYVAGDTTESSVYTTGSMGSLLDNLNNIRHWGLPSKNFWATQTYPLTSSLDISSGEWYYIDGQPPLVFSGGSSPLVTAPVGGDRYDLLTINTSGVMAWISGTVSATPSLPTFPSATDGILPLWAVYSRSSGSVIVNVDDGISHYLYRDYRPFIGGPTVFPSTGSAYIDYQWYADGPLSTGSGINGIYYIPDDFAMTGSFGYVKTTPSSGSVIVDIQYSTNSGTSWTSVYSGAKLNILSGDNYGSRTPDVLTLSSGTLVRANLDNAGGGSASSLSVNLFGTIRSASGGGTVSGISVSAIDGIIGSVTNPNTNATINLHLGNITPDSVVSAGVVSGSNLSGTNTGDQTITLTGDVTGSGNGSFATDISATGVTAGSYTLANITVDNDGRILIASSGSGTASIYPFPAFQVGATASSGSLPDASAGDHVHQGVTSIIPEGYSSVYGNIMLKPGTNTTITYSSGSVVINSTGGGSVTFATVPQANAGTATNIAVDPAGLPLRVENSALINNQSYGGNARGGGAVDFQSSRSAVSQVSSGSYSGIMSGKDNTASANYSVISGGQSNLNAQSNGVIAGGQNNTNQAGGNFGAICGGFNNLIGSSSSSGFIGSGEGNIVDSQFGIIPGGQEAKVINTGQMSHASGMFSTAGDAQGTVQMVVRRAIDHSVDTGWQNLYLDGTYSGTSSDITIPTNSAWTVDILISAATVGLASRANYRIVGAVANLAGTTQIDAQTVTTLFETTAAWNVQLAVTGNNLLIQVTDGSDTETIRWVATIRTCELGY